MHALSLSLPLPPPFTLISHSPDDLALRLSLLLPLPFPSPSSFAFSRLSLPLSLSPRDSLCHFGPRRFHGQSVSDSCQWPTRCVRASRRGLTTANTGCACVTAWRACVRACVNYAGNTRSRRNRSFRALTYFSYCLSVERYAGESVCLLFLAPSEEREIGNCCEDCILRGRREVQRLQLWTVTTAAAI